MQVQGYSLSNMADQSVILTREKVEARDVSLDHLTNCRVEISRYSFNPPHFSTLPSCQAQCQSQCWCTKLEEDREKDLDCEVTTHGMKEGYAYN